MDGHPTGFLGQLSSSGERMCTSTVKSAQVMKTDLEKTIIVLTGPLNSKPALQGKNPFPEKNTLVFLFFFFSVYTAIRFLDYLGTSSWVETSTKHCVLLKDTTHSACGN